MLPRYIKNERHNTRDLRYNNWHRTLHMSLIWQDIDGIEYDYNDNPLVVLELKHHCNSQVNEGQNRRIIKTANKLEVPAFEITYYPIGYDAIREVDENPSDWGFKFNPLNELANDLMERLDLVEGKKYNGKEYEQFLLNLRRK